MIDPITFISTLLTFEFRHIFLSKILLYGSRHDLQGLRLYFQLPCMICGVSRWTQMTWLWYYVKLGLNSNLYSKISYKEEELSESCKELRTCVFLIVWREEKHAMQIFLFVWLMLHSLKIKFKNVEQFLLSYIFY